MAFDLSDYVDVAARLQELRDKHPDASLQPLNAEHPFRVVDVGGSTFIYYAAACFRSPTDERPGVGVAWEPFPGRTPYTKDSELQNAETSAWGRAIVAALAADTKRGIASADEVRNRSESAPPSTPAVAHQETPDAFTDVILNPDHWYDNRAEKAKDKKKAKHPDFKAKTSNPQWGQAGEPWNGKPQPMALWLRDAPPNFADALATGDVSLLSLPIEPKAARGKTVEEAKAQLGGEEVPPPSDDEAPF